MPKDDSGRDLQKHTLHLYKGEFDIIGQLFPKTTPSEVIRKLVHDLIKRTEGDMPNVEIDL